jgi:hypothetical protein
MSQMQNVPGPKTSRAPKRPNSKPAQLWNVPSLLVKCCMQCTVVWLQENIILLIMKFMNFWYDASSHYVINFVQKPLLEPTGICIYALNAEDAINYIIILTTGE